MYDIPFLDLPPMTGASGTVQLPGSKSISNRVLLLAGLASGTTAIHDLLDSDDTQVMLQALRCLGCGVDNAAGVCRITGLGGRLRVHEAQLFLGNAGTAMRPLTAALAVLAATQGGSFELRGVQRMHERPIADLVQALRALGCQIEELGQPGYPPLRVHGQAQDQAGDQSHDPPCRPLALDAPIRIRGDVSSQFLTALLMAMPLVEAQASAADRPGSMRPIVIEVVGELISKPYIEITLNLMARFGVQVQREGWQRFIFTPADPAPQAASGSAAAGSQSQHRGCAGYRAVAALHVEGDASSASYFIALGGIAAHGGAPLRIEGVGADSIQGDIQFVQAAQAMGVQVKAGANWIEVHRGRWPLSAVDMDCNHIPDAAMTLAVMALYADGPCRLSGIASWRVKETDRIAAMAHELRKIGAVVEAGEDFITVTPPQGWRHAQIETYDDHRMAMCLSLAAFNPLRQQTKTPCITRILDPRCVGKTFPDYFETLFGVAQADPAHLPVITIDGPTASGKGSLASAVAAALGFQLLDSGALYRAAGLAASWDGVAADDEKQVARIASLLDLRFGQGKDAGRTWLRGQEVTETLRQEGTGMLASQVSALPLVRQALHGLQLSFLRAPGLVADGRDMGTVVFAQAPLKVFLTASPAQRAQRRHKQLISKGFSSNITGLRAALEARDARDASRRVSPCVAAPDAQLLDNSELSIEESVQQVLQWWQQRGPFA